MEFEIINEKIGRCGLYSVVSFLLLSVPNFKQAVDFQALNFALFEPPFKCDLNATLATNGSNMGPKTAAVISYDQCSYKLKNDSGFFPCTKWTYERTEFQSSLVTELDLVCSKRPFQNLMYTVYFIGGLTVFPVLIWSDKYGRRAILIGSVFASIPITLGQVVANSIWIQLPLGFLSGISKSLYVTMAMTTLAELTTDRNREISLSNFWFFYTVGYTCTAGFGYATRSWRMIYLLSMIPCGFYFMYFCFIPETPRWLMLKGKREEAYKVLSFITKINRRTLLRKDFDEWKVIEQEPGRFFSIFKHKGMIGRCLILCFIEWTFSMSYIASSTDTSFASNNIFITVLVMGLIEFPTGPLAVVMEKRFGRKRGIISQCIFGSICLIFTPFVEADLSKSVWQPWVKALLAMGGKLGFTTAWCIVDCYVHELIPTTNRNGAQSIISVVAGTGTIMAQSIHNSILSLYYAGPCILYSFLLIVIIFLVSVFLPETKGKPLFQTMDKALEIKMATVNIELNHKVVKG